MADTPEPLRNVTALWIEKLKRAAEYKWKVFGEDAAEALKFYNGPHDFMYEGGYSENSRGFNVRPSSEHHPAFKMTVNKVAEMVQLFGPVLYARNPYRIVRPRQTWVPPAPLVLGPPPDPMMPLDPIAQQMTLIAAQRYQQMLQQMDMRHQEDMARAQLLEMYLNYTPREIDLKGGMRMAIDEALIKGMGVTWCELWTPPGSGLRIAGNFYDTVDNLLGDPDSETVEDWQWCARRCCHPVWQVEQEYGLPPGTLRGGTESVHRQTQVDTHNYGQGPYDRKRGTTNDLVEYWKVYSKMGLGAKLQGADPSLRKALDSFGDHAYLVICKDVPYPLNMAPGAVEQVKASGDEQAAQAFLQQLEWPTPWWADNEWPFTDLCFHKVPRCAWPMSHVKPAMGEQKFLNWAYSFLAGKIRNTCRDFVAVLKAAGEDMKAAILKGEDLTLLEIESQFKTISEVVQFLQHPPMNGDIFKVIQAVEENFEKRTGLSEMMYGQTSTQSRSAEETATKRAFLQVRPDDMAERVEEMATRMARKEAILARWHLTAEDVAPILGPEAAQFWGQLVQSADFQQVVREMDYSIEAGSTRKPNKEAILANIDQGTQVILPVLQQYSFTTGDFGPVNEFIAQWGKARDFDTSGLTLKPLPPPPPPEAAPSPGESPSKNGANGKPASSSRF